MVSAVGATVILVAAVLIIKVEQSISTIKCPEDNYVVNSKPPRCMLCNKCPDGRGLSPPCGSTLDHPPSDVDCKSCIQGKTFSTEYDSSTCKKCHICTTGIKKNCTIYSDTVCKENCKSALYYENATHDCQPCSHCCGDNTSDIRIHRCVEQGMPRELQCSIHNAQKCTPTSTRQTPIVTSSPRSGFTNTTKGSKSSNKFSVVGVATGVGGTVGVVLLAIFFCLIWRRRKRQGGRDVNRIQGIEDGGGEEEEMLQQRKCGLKLQEPQDVQYEREVSEGERSISFRCLVDHIDHTPNCAPKYQWLQDDAVIQRGTRSELLLEDIQVSDFGIYQCKVCCFHCGPEACFTNYKQELNVKPSQGKRYKRLDELSQGKRDKIANLLTKKTPGISNWKHVGEHYGIEGYILDANPNEIASAEFVIAYLHSSKPLLTVYDFCKYLKTIDRMDIVVDLKDDLTINDENEPLRDSGIDMNSSGSGNKTNSSQFDQPTHVELKPQVDSPPAVPYGYNDPVTGARYDGNINNAAPAEHSGYAVRAALHSGVSNRGLSDSPAHSRTDIHRNCSSRAFDSDDERSEHPSELRNIRSLNSRGGVTSVKPPPSKQPRPQTEPTLNNAVERERSRTEPASDNAAERERSRTDTDPTNDNAVDRERSRTETESTSDNDVERERSRTEAEPTPDNGSERKRSRSYGRQTSSGSNKSDESESSGRPPSRKKSSSLKAAIVNVKDKVLRKQSSTEPGEDQELLGGTTEGLDDEDH